MFTTLALALPLAAALVTGAALYRPDLTPAALERRYADTTSRFVEVGGLRLHVTDAGRGPPILLIHGASANLFAWDAWAAALAEGRRVVRLDLPGHGLTGPDPQRRYRPDAMAALIVELMDRLAIERAVVAGNSLGGAVGWQLAARHPERVDRLVLVAPVGYPIEGDPPLIFRLLANPVLGRAALRFTYRRAFADRARQTWGDPARLDERLIDRDYALFRRAGNRDALLAMFTGAGAMQDPRPLLGRIQAPTLILWGTADRITPPAMADRFARDIPHAEVALVEGAGHAPQTELPEASLAPVTAFLAQP